MSRSSWYRTPLLILALLAFAGSALDAHGRTDGLRAASSSAPATVAAAPGDLLALVPSWSSAALSLGVAGSDGGARTGGPAPASAAAPAEPLTGDAGTGQLTSSSGDVVFQSFLRLRTGAASASATSLPPPQTA